ncbi:putative membrane protein [Candidatus Phytoplasma solani]|uniref:hypothetical protein n=1 Tax=Candidatus Phytoplasma solani TaxID=69896 RepID=UPI0032DAC575
MNSKYNRTFIISILIFFTIVIFLSFLFFNYQGFFVDETSNDETEEIVSSITPEPHVSDSNIDVLKNKILNKLGDVTEKIIDSKQVNKHLNELPSKLTSFVFKGKKTKN